MNQVTTAAVIGLVNAVFEILRTHLGKPEGWRPTEQDWDDLVIANAEATPEKEKADAAARLGIPWPPVE